MTRAGALAATSLIFISGCASLLPDDGHEDALVSPQGWTRVVLVQDEFEVNATGGTPEAFMGPHCAPVRLSTEPAALTFRVAGDAPFTIPTHTVVRLFEGKGNYATTSADRTKTYTLPGDGSVTLESPFQPVRTLATLDVRMDHVLLDETRVPRDGAVVEHVYETPTEGGDATVHERVTVRDLGMVPARVERTGLCA